MRPFKPSTVASTCCRRSRNGISAWLRSLSDFFRDYFRFTLVSSTTTPVAQREKRFRLRFASLIETQSKEAPQWTRLVYDSRTSALAIPKNQNDWCWLRFRAGFRTGIFVSRLPYFASQFKAQIRRRITPRSLTVSRTLRH